jgi:hypothetical protein
MRKISDLVACATKDEIRWWLFASFAASMTRRRLVCNQRRMLLTVMDYLNKK